MALLDEKRDAFVVRIVYDGPPFSGKTTTLRMLSSGLSRPLESPEEHEGRTLFFDWLDYTAGRFEGRPIRCQVVSVPGQRRLSQRRRQLLAEADSVVFVADTGTLGMELSLKYARELSAFIAKLDAPRPGIVVQANKRDVEDALPIPQVLEAFRSIGVEAALIETTANSGSGVRETFLFGVRLALDRVRELAARGLLKSGRPDVDSAPELLKQIGQSDGVSAGSVVGDQGGPAATEPTDSAGSRAPERLEGNERGTEPTSAPVVEAVREALSAEQGRLPNPSPPARASVLPDPTVPSGLIWPPIEGRIILQQALSAGSPTVRRLQSGHWYAYSQTGWRLHSRFNDLFEDQNAGRSALVEWARVHVRNQELLSGRRCIVLSEDGSGWRLWQIVGAVRSLDVFLAEEQRSSSRRRAVEALLVATSKLLGAADLFNRATTRLPVGLATIAADEAEPRYLGMMPGFDVEERSARAPIDAAAIVMDRMNGSVAKFAAQFGREALAADLQAIAPSSSAGTAAVDTLSEIFRTVQAA